MMREDRKWAIKISSTYNLHTKAALGGASAALFERQGAFGEGWRRPSRPSRTRGLPCSSGQVQASPGSPTLQGRQRKKACDPRTSGDRRLGAGPLAAERRRRSQADFAALHASGHWPAWAFRAAPPGSPERSARSVAQVSLSRRSLPASSKLGRATQPSAGCPRRCRRWRPPSPRRPRAAAPSRRPRDEPARPGGRTPGTPR